MKFYRFIERFVDDCIKDRLYFKAAMLPGVVMLLVSMVAGWPKWLGIFLLVGWTTFVFWRWYLHVKNVSRDSDRHYDRTGKYRLSKEYHDSESATAARDRKVGRNG